jgi:hypothetical protein
MIQKSRSPASFNDGRQRSPKRAGSLSIKTMRSRLHTLMIEAHDVAGRLAAKDWLIIAAGAAFCIFALVHSWREALDWTLRNMLFR